MRNVLHCERISKSQWCGEKRNIRVKTKSAIDQYVVGVGGFKLAGCLKHLQMRGGKPGFFASRLQPHQNMKTAA